MATIRRKRHTERSGRITSDALAAFKAGDQKALQAALRLPVWQVSPLDAVGECPWPPGAAGEVMWGDSVELREALHGNR